MKRQDEEYLQGKSRLRRQRGLASSQATGRASKLPETAVRETDDPFQHSGIRSLEFT